MHIFVLNMNSDFANEVICKVLYIEQINPQNYMEQIDPQINLQYFFCFRPETWSTVPAMCGSHMAGIQESGGRMAHLNAVEMNWRSTLMEHWVSVTFPSPTLTQQ